MEAIYDTQKRNIRAYLETGKGISQLEALEMFGCFRLSAVIFRLKNDDQMEIDSKWDTAINSKGQVKRFKVYYKHIEQ